MDVSATRGGWESQENYYVDWYPRVVALGHRLAARRQLQWGAKNSEFMLLVRNGCRAADAALDAIRIEDVAVWRQLSPRARVNIAVRTAARAMVIHLQDKTC